MLQGWRHFLEECAHLLQECAHLRVTATCGSKQDLMCHSATTPQVAVHASSIFAPVLDLRHLCLDYVAAGGGQGGSWSAAANDMRQWVQASFGATKVIGAIATKGDDAVMRTRTRTRTHTFND